MPIKAGMISLGCPKNQVDAEVMLASLRAAGMELTPNAGLADVVVVNTCGFIEDAKRESIENILEMAKLKKEGSIRGIVVTGCLAERYFKEMRAEIPEIDCILAVGSEADIVDAVRRAYEGKSCDRKTEPRLLPFGGERVLTTLPFYSYLKIAEGCDNRCSYCVIPSLRGPFRSRPLEELTAEAETLAKRGVRELVLVAQDTTRYGEDLYGRPMLAELLRRVARIDGLVWLRVLYAYPDRITDELIETIAAEKKVAPYIDIPIQHVNARVLRAMNRHGSKENLLALIEKMRAAIPSLTLRTTVITGFPGETEEEFAELMQFLKDVRFERLGAFAYSQEDGTPAAAMDGQIPEEVKKRRQELIMEQQAVIMEENNRKMVGRTIPVLAEGYDRWAECWFGRGAADAPDIDGKVFFTAGRRVRPGDFVPVHVDEVLDYDLKGTAEKE